MWLQWATRDDGSHARCTGRVDGYLIACFAAVHQSGVRRLTVFSRPPPVPPPSEHRNTKKPYAPSIAIETHKATHPGYLGVPVEISRTRNYLTDREAAPERGHGFQPPPHPPPPNATAEKILPYNLDAMIGMYVCMVSKAPCTRPLTADRSGRLCISVQAPLPPTHPRSAYCQKSCRRLVSGP